MSELAGVIETLYKTGVVKAIGEDVLASDFVKQKTALFDAYREKILEYNEKVNITRIVEKDDFERRHYIDSLMCCTALEFRKAGSIIDIGSGGGFPGVPLAIMFPEKEFVLMDSSGKRIKIVDEITSLIGISNVRTIHGRAEELGRKEEYREQFDLCVSRAVASMATLSEYCIPFVKIGGAFIAYKGPGSDEEISASVKAIGTLGGKISRIEEAGDTIFYAPGNEGHRLVCISKESPTPPKYPRGGGKPSKKPL